VAAVAHQEKEEGVRRREKGRGRDHLSARGGNGSAGRTIEGAEPHERRCPYAFFRGRDMLIIEVKTGDGKYVRQIEFTPSANSLYEDTVIVGATKMHVMVAWSLVDL
jgi:hypothetical protein